MGDKKSALLKGGIDCRRKTVSGCEPLCELYTERFVPVTCSKFSLLFLFCHISVGSFAKDKVGKIVLNMFNVILP
jgi:hypothetical protein